MMKILTLLLLITSSSIISNGQSNEYLVLNHNNVNRNYTVHLPTGYDSTQNLPLVINMHGMGGNVSSHIFYSNFNTIADTGDFIVVYPQGLTGTTLWGATATQWDSYFGTGTKDLEFLDTLIDQMYFDYNINLKKVYSTGHSNGGYMSYRLACELSDRIAAIASVAGAMTFQQENNCNITHPMPILQIHGTADVTVPFSGTPLLNSSIPNLMNYWQNKNNCINDSILTIIFDSNTTDNCTASSIDFIPCDSNVQVLLYKVDNGGHSWPGAFDYPPLGNTCQDFNASSVIWNFFNKYELENPVIPEIPLVDETTGELSLNIKVEKVNVYPNPFSDVLEIEMSNSFLIDDDEIEITIFDIYGRKVIVNTQLSNNKIIIDTKNLKKGIYTLVISNSTNKEVLKRIKVVKDETFF